MKLQIFMIAFACFSSSFSQNLQRSSLGSSGNSSEIIVNNKTYYISESVGQNSVIGTFNTANYTIRQGFQQPEFRLKIIPSANNSLNALVFPNPVNTQVNISLSEKLDASIEVIVYDFLGKKIIQKTQSSVQTFTVDMSFLASGMYLLKLKSNQKEFIATLIKK
jgi:hypothetical protein